MINASSLQRHCSLRVSLLPHSKLLHNSFGRASRNIKMFYNSNTPKKSYLLVLYLSTTLYHMRIICLPFVQSVFIKSVLYMYYKYIYYNMYYICTTNIYICIIYIMFLIYICTFTHKYIFI